MILPALFLDNSYYILYWQFAGIPEDTPGYPENIPLHIPYDIHYTPEYHPGCTPGYYYDTPRV